MRIRLASFTSFALAVLLACTPPTLTPTVYPPSSGNTTGSAAALPLPDVTLDQCGPAPSAGPVYLEGQVTKRPTLIRAGQPRYPEVLRAAGISGRVKYAFIIDPTGRAVESSLRTLEITHPGFDEPARTMLLASRFAPAQLEGQPVSVCTAQTIHWNP